MKKICILQYLTLMIILSFSCKTIVEPNFEIQYGLDKFKLPISKGKYKIYVIPNSGCSTCITNVEHLAQKNIDSSNMIFVFTRITSLKLFKNRFTPDFYNKSNVILDTSNLFIFPNNNEEIYPVVFSSENGNINKVNVLSPKYESKNK